MDTTTPVSVMSGIGIPAAFVTHSADWRAALLAASATQPEAAPAWLREVDAFDASQRAWQSRPADLAQPR